jgi:hypothetical protein
MLAERFFEIVDDEGFKPLPLNMQHAHLAGAMPGRHRDPFDRMLAAQAQIENVPLVTADPVFRAFGTRVLWEGAAPLSPPPTSPLTLGSAPRPRPSAPCNPSGWRACWRW